MPRTTQYVTLLKKLIEASKQDDQEYFHKVVDEIRSQMNLLNDEERFDMEMNLKSEIKGYKEKHNL